MKRFSFCAAMIATLLLALPPASAQQQAPVPAQATPAQAAPAASQAVPSAASATVAPAESAATRLTISVPRELSPWSMFMSADVVVKGVMIGLAFASLITWTM